MAPLELVIFDLDGVLVDSSPAHAAAFEALYRALGIAGPPYADIAGRPTRSVVEELLAGHPEQSKSIDHWVAFKQAAARRHLEGANVAFTDANPALAALDACGVGVAIGTSASRVTTQAVLRTAGWADRFPIVMTAEDVQAGKPDPEIYVSVMQRARMTPERTLVVEDSRAGLEAALSSGAWAVSVRTGMTARHERFLGSLSDLEGLAGVVLEGAAWTASS